MTAYRSSNDYRQDTLRYDGGTNVTVTPAVIAATSTAPAVTVGEGTGVTVTPAVIATAATTPAVTVEILLIVNVDTVTGTAALPAVTVTEGAGVTVNVATVSGSGLIPDSTISVGTGVTATPAVIAGTVTIPEETVSVGTGQNVSLATVTGTTTVPELNLSSLIVLIADTPVALLDVLPYHVVTPQRRWKSRFAATGRRGLNVFILTDNTVTTRHPVDPSTISRQILAGHESPTDLTAEESTLLINAGYSFKVE